MHFLRFMLCLTCSPMVKEIHDTLKKKVISSKAYHDGVFLQNIAQYRHNACLIGSSGGVVFWLKEQEVRGLIPGLIATISEAGYLLLPSRDIAERSLF